MAQLRLILLVALTACRASEAGPTSGLAVPAGWRAMPELATAATDAAKAAKITVDGVEAWGEPSRGCYGAWMALRGDAGAPELLGEKLVMAVSGDPALAGITVTDIVKPAKDADAGVLSLSFARGAYTGRVRAQIARTGAYAVLACFWNQREPVACESSCGQLVGSMK